jgi:hypothetical protein
MLSTTSTATERLPYALLGRLLLRSEPEKARELLDSYRCEAQPIETDFARIPDHFTRFCSLKGLHPKDYIGALHKTSLVEVRRTFIAAMIHMYLPQAFTFPDARRHKDGWGLIKTLARHFGQSKSVISKMAREAIAWSNEYEDFNESVLSIFHQMNAHGHEEATA